jgi:hypothetical protein
MFHCINKHEIENNCVHFENGEFVDGEWRFLDPCPKCGGEVFAGFLFDTHVGIGASGDFELISESLAVTPSQVQEHRQAFPDIEVKDDGRLRFTDRKKYNNYLKKTGMLKQHKGHIIGP